MKTFLSLFMCQTEESIGCRVLKMDECLRIGNKDYSVDTPYGMNIRSFQYPELTKNSFYFPGSDKKKDSEFFTGYTWEESVDEFKSRVVEAIYYFLGIRFGCIVDIRYHMCSDGWIVDFVEFDGISQMYTKE